MKKTLALLALALASTFAAKAQSPDFFANISISGTNTLATSPGVLAPATTDIWFVADKTGSGLGIGPSGSSVLDTVIAGWLAGGGDDVSVFEGTVPGSLPGIPTNNGKFTRNNTSILQSEGVTFNDDRLTSPTSGQLTKVWAILWNDSTAGDVGDKFGVLELTISNIPTVGNATWTIGGSIIANQYTVAAIPEPSTYAMMLLGGLGVLGYRRFKK